MDDKEFRAKMMRAASTPGSRIKDWFYLQLARVGMAAVVIGILIYLSHNK